MINPGEWRQVASSVSTTEKLICDTQGLMLQHTEDCKSHKAALKSLNACYNAHKASFMCIIKA